MPTLKELHTQARAYGLRKWSKLKKSDLRMAIAKVRAAGSQKRLQRAMKTGRFSAITGDVLNPQKKDRRRHELAMLDREVDLSLRAGKKVPAVKRARLRRQLAEREEKPHLHGLTRSWKETLARAIARRGTEILRDRPLRSVKEYQDEILDQFVDAPEQSQFHQTPTVIGNLLRGWEMHASETQGADPKTFLEGVRPQIREKLEEEIRALGGIKFHFSLKIQLRKDRP